MNAKVRCLASFLAVIAALGLGGGLESPPRQRPTAGGRRPDVPGRSVWPKFDGNWIFGSIGGVFVDPTNDHVWVLNRPRTIETMRTSRAEAARRRLLRPAAIRDGVRRERQVSQGLGWSGHRLRVAANEHGLSIDAKGNFWIASNGKGDAQVLKFNRDGKFLLQIGHFGKSNGSNDTENFASPTKATYYAKTNEVFVSDGYINRRLAVFDADTGNTSATGAPTARSPTILRRGPVPSTARPRSSSLSPTTCRFRTTTWCMWQTDRTTAFRCSGRMGRS